MHVYRYTMGKKAPKNYDGNRDFYKGGKHPVQTLSLLGILILAA